MDDDGKYSSKIIHSQGAMYVKLPSYIIIPTKKIRPNSTFPAHQIGVQIFWGRGGLRVHRQLPRPTQGAVPQPRRRGDLRPQRFEGRQGHRGGGGFRGTAARHWNLVGEAKWKIYPLVVKLI